MSIDTTLKKIALLSGLYPDEVIAHAQAHDRKRIYRYIGKILPPVDADLLSFLLHFNHVSLPGCSFLGIGDNEQAQDLYRFTGTCWENNSAICPYFLVFAIGPSGQLIGSLTNYKGGKQYPIACLSSASADEFVFIGSGFGIFLNNLLDYTTDLLSSGIRHADSGIFLNQAYWKGRDAVLEEHAGNGLYKTGTDENWKQEFGFL